MFSDVSAAVDDDDDDSGGGAAPGITPKATDLATGEAAAIEPIVLRPEAKGEFNECC